MTNLHELKPALGALKKRKRVGRGEASGYGKTSGRGNKGQKSRSGGNIPPWFEGGQMPLTRRIPKRGFKNINRIEYYVINIDRLQNIQLKKNEKITPELLRDKGLIKKKNSRIKILGRGDINKPLQVVAHAFSKSAEEKILAAGGSIEVVYQ